MNVKAMKLLSVVLALVMAVSMLPATAFATNEAGRFADVRDGDWCNDAVRYVSDNGLMIGVSDNHFAPDGLTTRGMVVTVLYRMEGEPSTEATGFTDVEDGEWYTASILWAQANGIVEGYDDGTFRPNASMTREDMMVVFYRYSRHRGYDVSCTYSLTALKDNDRIQPYAEDAMSWATSAGLIKGFPDGTIRPQAESNRAQLAAVLMRFCDTFVGGEDTVYTRSEWIKLIIETYGYPECNLDENYYSDIAECEYVSEINTAVAYGILPFTGGEFTPDSVATREFAAETAINSMGYIIPETKVNCADVSEIGNPCIANLALELGLLELESNKYYPNRPLTSSEAIRILEIIEDTYESTLPSDDSVRGIGYLDSVTVLNDAQAENIDEDTIRISLRPDLEGLQEGDIIVIDTESAYKVICAEYTESDVEITYSSPELNEYLDYIDIQGDGYLDFSQFVPADGVSVTYNGAQKQSQPFGWHDGIDLPDTEIDLDIDLKLTGEIDLGNDWMVNYEMGIAMPAVSYKVDVDFNPLTGILPGVRFVDVRNVYFKLEESIGVKVDVGAFNDDIGLLNEPFFKPIQLGFVPIVGTDGFGALVEINLVLNSQGSLEIQLNQAGVLGVQVLNNRPRNISAFDISSSFGVVGEIKVGPQLYFVAEAFDKDLISFGLDIGGCISASVHQRSTGMICVDGRFNAYAELSAFDKCLLDDWLDIAIVWEIWNESKGPINKGFHCEDMIYVSKCTYDKYALISGAVANAENRSQFIENAKIEIRHFGTMDLVETEYTDVNGRYSAVVEGGTYVIQISAKGYIPFQSQHTVSEKQDIFVETFLMVAGEEGTNEVGIIGGCITNAVTGRSVENVTLTIRKGWNQTDGEIVTTTTTDSDGIYRAELPLGNYTIYMEKSSYISDHFNVAVTKSTNLSWHSTLNPSGESSIPTGDLRIVLTWGESPRDLDSHLLGPTVDSNSRFHIYFSNMKYSNRDTVYAFLDLDDVDSYGPETTTIYSINQCGTYSFYVHDFTNSGNSANTQLANSNAKVTVFVGEQIVATYHIPVNGVGDVWHVFDFDADTRSLIPINTFTTVGDSSLVGMP